MQVAKNTPNNRQVLVGVFLYYEGADYISKVSAALQDFELTRYWGKIRNIKANSGMVSNLIPFALQDGAESWLILYRIDVQEQFLVLPFLVEEDLPLMTDTEAIRRYISALMEVVHGGQEQWYPLNGFRNLIENLKRDFHPIPRRFQVVRVNKPFQDLFQERDVFSQQTVQQEIVNTLTRTSQHIQQRRNETLELALADEQSKQSALQDFETFIIKESKQLSELIIARHSAREVVPQIVHDFANVMDEETKRFLISAETVAHFAKKHLRDGFDFSVAGCGLWKAVERELNLSLIWHLRRHRGIAENEPLKAVVDEDPEGVKVGAVNLDEREQKGAYQFKGIMLGDTEFMLRAARRNGIVQEITTALDEQLATFVLSQETNSLASAIKELRTIRNGYAHIRAMPYPQYQCLHSLVISVNDKPYDSLLRKVLEIKTAIVHYWETHNT